MPEGPEVRIVADWLKSRYIGVWLNPYQPVQFDARSRYALTSDLLTVKEYVRQAYQEGRDTSLPITDETIRSIYKDHTTLDLLVPQLIKDINKRRLHGYDLLFDWSRLQITDIQCKGKKIFFVLQATSNGSACLGDTTIAAGETRPLYLMSSLGMTGKWVSPLFNGTEAIETDPHTNLWLNLTRSIQEQKLLQIESLFYSDSRHMGEFRVLTTDQFTEKWNKLGPDLLAEEIDYSVWDKCISRPRLAAKQICDFLMSQQYFCGIGNYLKAEILYACRIRPDRLLGQLSEVDKRALLHHSQRIIRESYRCSGATLYTFYTPGGQPGTFQRLVYGHPQDPEGHPVVVAEFGDRRKTYWVPAVQV